MNPYVGEIADFVAAIRDGRPPEVDGAEGLRNVELLCEAAPLAVSGSGFRARASRAPRS